MEHARPEMVLVGPGQLGRTVALRIAARLQAAVKERGVATLALSGGPQTPWVYRDLRELALPWERIEFWFADERCVPERHPASNWYAAADLLARALLEFQHYRVDARVPACETRHRHIEELPRGGLAVAHQFCQRGGVVAYVLVFAHAESPANAPV